VEETPECLDAVRFRVIEVYTESLLLGTAGPLIVSVRASFAWRKLVPDENGIELKMGHLFYTEIYKLMLCDVNKMYPSYIQSVAPDASPPMLLHSS
jgi:hypothetical protein